MINLRSDGVRVVVGTPLVVGAGVGVVVTGKLKNNC